ncbi:MAG: Mu transposase C-terminal domain-containing protein [Ferrovibrionaceae bacterium]
MAAGSTLNAAVADLIAGAKHGTLRPALQKMVAAANARGGKAGGRTLSRSTLMRWRDEHRRGGWDALAPRPTDTAREIPEWAVRFLTVWQSPQQRSIAHCIEIMAREHPGLPVPSPGQARRLLDAMAPAERERGRMGPNARLALKAFKRRDYSALKPLELVLSDGHSFKADVRHPVHGKPFTCEVVSIMDAKTRLVFGWSAGLSESAWTVLDALRCGVERLGLFGAFFTDNGAGFVAQAMDHELVTGFLARMGVTHLRALPGRAQSRGTIERLQGTLWKRAARTLATYKGRDMDAEARRRMVRLIDADVRAGTSNVLMTWQQFLDWAEAQVDDYNNRPHSGLPRIVDPATGTMRHQTPTEALAAEVSAGWAPELVPEEMLSDLFRPYELRQTRRGEIVLPWGRYFDPALARLDGRMMRVGYDIHDGSRVWVRSNDDGRLVCIAQRDGNVIAALPSSKREHIAEKRRLGRERRLQDQLDLVQAEAAAPAITAQLVDIEVEALPAPRRPETQVERENRLYEQTKEIQARIDAGADVGQEDRDWLGWAVEQPFVRARREAENELAELLARSSGAQ